MVGYREFPLPGLISWSSNTEWHIQLPVQLPYDPGKCHTPWGRSVIARCRILNLPTLSVSLGSYLARWRVSCVGKDKKVRKTSLRMEEIENIVEHVEPGLVLGRFVWEFQWRYHFGSPKPVEGIPWTPSLQYMNGQGHGVDANGHGSGRRIVPDRAMVRQ